MCLVIGVLVCAPISRGSDDFAFARMRNRVNQPDVVGGWASDRLIVRLVPGFIPSSGVQTQESQASDRDPAATPALSAFHPESVEAFRQLLTQWQVSTTKQAIELPMQDRALASQLGLDRYYVLRVPLGTDVRAFADALRQLPDLVEVAEVDGIGGLLDVPRADDPFLSSQYAIENLGQVVAGERGAAGADTACLRAWELSTGSGDVILAVLDTGASNSHPDLAEKILPGINFTTIIPNANTDDSSFISHGTGCAGIAAAATNNGIGISGVSWGSRVLPVKVANAYGLSSELICTNGLIWAADHGALVATMSLGFPEGTTLFELAVEYAHLRGLVLCSSTGNTPGEDIFYPARFSRVIAVGATNNRDELATFTTTGPELFICAPGVDILTTWDVTSNPNGYSYETGTSLSCPIVAGIACLIRAANPTLSNDQVKFVLQVSADDLGEPGRDDEFGWGRVNALAALQLATNSHRICTADWNNDGVIDSRDVFDFVTMYLENTADFDRDGKVDSFDFFGFISSYFGGC